MSISDPSKETYIGHFIETGFPIDDSAEAAKRFFTASLFTKLIVSAAIQAHGSELVKSTTNDDKSGKMRKDLYADPPLADPLQAVHVANAIRHALELAKQRTDFEPGVWDTFIPATASDTV